MRIICSPVSKNAMDRLDLGNEYEGDLLEIIIDDELYRKVWELGFFDEINKEINIYIDDYEDESIRKKLELIKLNSINRKYKKYGDFFWKMEKLILNAIINDTGIFFFF